MRRLRRTSLAVEPLEGRYLQASLTMRPPRVVIAGNTSDGSGYEAILAALRGGAGSEFVTLIRRGFPDIQGLVRQFALGQRTSATTRGFSVKTPKFQPAYTGPQLDQFNPTAAGAVLLRDGRLELAAIMRGPIDLPLPTTYVWGINRGTGDSDPEGFGIPTIRYDSTVSVTRIGTSITATITDRKTGETSLLDPASVKIQGPTIRVFLDKPSLRLPSTGKPLNGYQFAFWTRSGDQGVAEIGGFIPGTRSIPIGVLGKGRRA